MKRWVCPKNPLSQFGGARTQIFVDVLRQLHGSHLMVHSGEAEDWRAGRGSSGSRYGSCFNHLFRNLSSCHVDVNATRPSRTIIWASSAAATGKPSATSRLLIHCLPVLRSTLLVKPCQS